MTPRTRSGGMAPVAPSIIFKTSPRLKQVQFPSRRKTVRTYGQRGRRRDGSVYKGDGEDGSSAATTPALKQKTLTQYDFGSSFNEDSVVELSDASDAKKVDDIGDSDEADKENISSSFQKASPRKPTVLRQLRAQRKADEDEESRVQVTESEGDGQHDDDEDGPIMRKRCPSMESANGTKTKRRRTLGEEHRMSTMRKSKISRRRRALGDPPVMTASSRSSRYHTQTLTQFMDRTSSFVPDSEDDGDFGSVEYDGFLEWLGDAEPQTPSKVTRTSKEDSIPTVIVGTTVAATLTTITADHSPSPYRRTRRKLVEQPREESVVPQTPIKTLRFDVPPSARHISPSPSRIAAVYGAPNPSKSPSSKRCGTMSSPLKPRTELAGRSTKLFSPGPKKPALVIQDSYATEAWSSVGGTQARHYTPSQTQTEVFSTPAEEMVTNSEAVVTQTPAKETRLQDQQQNLQPEPTQTQDSHTEQVFFGAVSQIAQDSTAASQQEQEQNRGEDKQQQPLTPKPKPQIKPRTNVMREIPDSDDDEGAFDTESDANEDNDGAEESGFAAGAETQLIMDQLHSSVRIGGGTPRARNATSSTVTSPHPPRLLSSSGAASPSSANTPQSVPSSSTKKACVNQQQKQLQKQRPNPQQRTKSGIIANDIAVDRQGAPLRRLLHHPEPIDTQGVPLESQRVPVATLQGFTSATPRTDILLPLSHRTLTNLLSGHQDTIVLPFKVPLQVVRFWLIHDGMLRHLACVSTPESSSSGGRSSGRYNPEQENGRGGQGTWTYTISQVYELNNAVTEADMRDEDWIHGQVVRYSYFPPAIVSQLLWNLRQAIFANDHDNDHADVAIPVAAAAGTVAFSSSQQQGQHQQQASSKKSTPHVDSQQGPLASSPSRATRLPSPSTMPAPPPPTRHNRTSRNHKQPHFIRPSQATTVSQASSIADIPWSPGIVEPGAAAAAAVFHHRQNLDESAESLIFDDHGGSSIPMSYSIAGLEHLAASQLLTKSQTLPESLIRDEERLPDEIWDSEEEQ